MLRLEGVSKRFGGLVATDGVSLEVAQGEVHALIGPNGAGKTTLIGQISGTVAPDAGEIFFEEKSKKLPLPKMRPWHTFLLPANNK